MLVKKLRRIGLVSIAPVSGSSVQPGHRRWRVVVPRPGVHEQSLDGEGADHHFGVQPCRGGAGVVQVGSQQAAGEEVKVVVRNSFLLFDGSD
jgi:hypothetical protein